MLKRTFCAVLALLMLAGAFPMPAFAEEATMETITVGGMPSALTGMTNTSSKMEESENNDSRSKADYIKYDMTQVHGRVGGSKDKYDYFKITLKQSVSIYMRAVSATKTAKFRIYSSSGKYLESADYDGMDGGDYWYSLSYTMSPGTYYIRVHESSSRVRSEYLFLFSMVPALNAPQVTAANDPETGKPLIRWNYENYTAKYEVYRATSKDGEYKYIGSTTYMGVIDNGTVAGKTYYYKVKAISGKNGIANSKLSSEVKVVCDCEQPSVWMTRRSTTGKNIINWEEVEGAKEYKVYCASSPNGTYKCIATTKKLKYVHGSGRSNKTYYYKVRAIGKKSGSTSAYSAIVSQTAW